MAFRATGYWRSIFICWGENRPYTTSTNPKMKLFAQTTDSAEANRPYNKFALTGELLPLYMVLGMMIGAAGIGTHTAFKQLEHCPNVSASKKKRTSILEVEDPDFIIRSAHTYINKSILRRVYRNLKEKWSTLPYPTRTIPFTSTQNEETLQAARVNPSHL